MGKESFTHELKVIHQSNKRNCVGQVYTSQRPNGVSSVVLKLQTGAERSECRYLLAKFYEMRGVDGEDVLRLNSHFADCLGLADNSLVKCSIIQCAIVPQCRRATVEVSYSDFELVGKNHSLIERHLLQQIQLVYKSLEFPLFIRRNRIMVTIGKKPIHNKTTSNFFQVNLDTDGNNHPDNIAFLAEGTKLEITNIGPISSSPEANPNYLCFTPSRPKSAQKITPNEDPGLSGGMFQWWPSLLFKVTGKIMNRDISIDEKTGSSFEIQNHTPEKTFVASQAAATARSRQGLLSPVEPEKRPSPIRKSGKLLRVQKKPSLLFEALEKATNDPEERCLIRQPTTIFVSDSTFPTFAENTRVDELLFSITTTTEDSFKATEEESNGNGNESGNGNGNGNGIGIGNGNGNGNGDAVPNKGRKISGLLKPVGNSVLAVARLYICQNDVLEESQQIQYGHVVLHDTMRRFLRARACSSILVKPLEGLNSKVQGITMQSVLNKVGGVYEKDKRESFWWWLKDISCDRYPIPVVNGQLASIRIKFQPMVGKIDFLINIIEGMALGSSHVEKKPKYFLLKPSMESHLIVATNAEALSPTNPDPETLKRLPPASIESLDAKLPPVQLTDLGGVDKEAEEGLNHLCSCLMNQVVFSLGNGCAGLGGGGLLIAGTTRDGAGSLGIGKTSLAYALCHAMTQQPILAHIVTLECALLRGKGVIGVQKKLKAVFDEAASHQPSIIFLDNLDYLISAPSSGVAETGGDALYSTKLAETLCDLLVSELHRGAVIALMATSRSKDSLHPGLMPRRGQHVFQKVLELKAPDKLRRREMLKAIVKRKNCAVMSEDTTLELVAQRTYGYGAQDLLKLIERTEHRSIAKELHRRSKTMMPQGGLAEPLSPTSDGQPRIARLFGRRQPLTYADFAEEIDCCKPESLRNIPLHSPGEKGWNDVGGLEDIKAMLIETFEWPAKYPELFSKCPLRLRSGLLLYGAPGTGKTLLAGVVAKECGLNFISIKGPELLNKYIGASEQAVRTMFERAQAAQPCILFFDEFDSIAPKRGHDNTGVTDRVVNQFLTQLDGIEGLHGVYVLAATSRPDLIDPALLRPGRLDKSLFLPMPDKEARVAILKALSSDVCLDGNVDLDEVASLTDFYSGADLKALLYNAQLESIRQSKEYATEGIDRAPPTPQNQKGVTLGVYERMTPIKNNSLPRVVEESDVHNEMENTSDLRFDFSSPLKIDSDEHADSERIVSAGKPKSKPKRLSLEHRASSDGSIDVVPVSGYFMPSIAEGVREMTHEVEKQMKSKYSEYLKRQSGPEGRRRSFATKALPKYRHQSSQADVRMEHIRIALLSMGPSLSESDRAKYQYTFDKFSNRGKGGTAPERIKQKITHA